MNKLKEKIKKIWRSPYGWPVIIAVVVGILIGLLIGGGTAPSTGSAVADHLTHDHETKSEIWTCSMHPQIRQPKPGKCPICGMDLIPVSTEEEEVGPRELKLSPTAIKLAEIRTKPVERRYVSTEVRMVGKVEYDETRLGYISSWVPGRIDRLYVDYTGTRVRKGDHLVYLYSPELITAQQELLQSLRTLEKYGTGVSDSIKRTARRTVEAAREKLRLWGLTRQQIRNIEKLGKPTDHLTIYSPMSGIVIRKNAVEGIYVKTGSKIYTIADLSKVWVKLDAYESDLPWIRYGQTVEFETEAYPGEIFKGRIAFIDPVLNPQTRTVKVRVNVDNPQYKLKPEMFVRAVVHSKLSMTGKVMDPDLAGKWICPMHPEIIKDGPGTCDICGMKVVKAEKLGYIVASPEEKEAPLVIPASAPLVTGTRAVVYVAVTGKEGTFAGREIVLGPRAGDYYLVKEGLREGEQVVVNGAFKIDSDLQIQAKPSMMSPEGSAPAPGHQHGDAAPAVAKMELKPGKEKLEIESIGKHNIPPAFRESIDKVADAYFAVQHTLSSDDLGGAQKSARDLHKKLAAVDMNLLKGNAHKIWMNLEKTIKASSQTLAQAKDIEAARVQLQVMTEPVSTAIKGFGSGKTMVYRFHCPMAFDNKGAHWLQNNSETRNPYFGSSMLTCKDSVEPLFPMEKEKQ
ncbi:MAG: efflux RND transporter periplasmic adaptor subunit [Candidatus Aminicenantes bacterium]|jgi:Cu(I)/Ag(I) efflux system membrane fusion protein